MSWAMIGITLAVLFVVFLGLFFWSSGAMVIDEEEKEDIKKKDPREMLDELAEVEKEDIASLKDDEDQFYSHG